LTYEGLRDIVHLPEGAAVRGAGEDWFHVRSGTP
jgi:hypothetical protein